MNEPTKNVENLTAKLKSVEPKFALKSKTIWGLILLVGLVLSIIFDLNPEEAMTKAEKLVGLLGGILTVLGIRTKSQPLTFKTKIPEGTTNLLLMGVMGISMAAVGVLSSCTHGLRPSLVNGHWSLGYKDEASGAKGGVTVSGGKFRPWGFLPIKDEAGEVVGGVSLGPPVSSAK